MCGLLSFYQKTLQQRVIDDDNQKEDLPILNQTSKKLACEINNLRTKRYAILRPHLKMSMKYRIVKSQTDLRKSFTINEI